MKKVTLLSLVLLSLCAPAQICHSFEDATTTGWTFNLPDRWRADNVSPINGLYSLHHVYDNSEAATDVATFSISGLCPECAEVRWDFTVRHGADPSSSNRWSFILMSDEGAVTVGSGYNGFAVGVNLTGYDDTLRLSRLAGGKATTIITTGINWQTDVGVDEAIRISVMRLPEGKWTIEVTRGSGNSAWSGNDPVIHRVVYAGVSYTYTSSRDRLLWIDDVCVRGVFIPDTLPPAVLSITALRPDRLQIITDEEPAAAFAREGNFSLSSDNRVTAVVRITPSVYELHLAKKTRNREPLTLTVDSLCDLTGNCSRNQTVSFVPVYAVTGDVVISEIMADPSPPIRLPEYEYLEITNRTGDSLNTGGWLLIAGRDTCRLPQRWIRGGEWLILLSAGREEMFAAYGEILGLASFPSLNDSGETIALRDGCGSLIHAVSFEPSFYNDGLRSGGGWSAELADVSNPFHEPDSWRASMDPSGGTPGGENSVKVHTVDNRCPEVIAAWPVASDMIRILFDETVMIKGDEPWHVGGDETLPALSDDISDRALLIPLLHHLKNGVISRIDIPVSVTDFAGNSVCVTELKTGIPAAPAAGEILFNELLPDPAGDCKDYLELFNNSDRIFNLAELMLTNSSSSPATPLTTVPRLLFPGDYVALTAGRRVLLDSYSCSDRNSVLEVTSLPAMPDDEGSLVLYDRAMKIIDRVDYSSSMHLLFLSGIAGIALEKVSPELPSAVKGNWHSASEACGWGTPGAENSVLLNSAGSKTGMALSAQRVSPDGDGFEDVLSVDIYPGGEDNIITVTVFNDRGFVVRKVAERFSAGAGARFVWDGTAESGARLPAGLYMIIAESFNSSGETRRWRETCALLYR